ncbi:MAG: HAMP domain-containing sensor histidine kinase [Gemmiger sp.]|nr:HAMP domain-containing sensor histidine kinase [Gemmiger sp.]
MSFLQDRATRRHLFAGLGIGVLGLLLCALFCRWAQQQAAALLLLREGQLVSALLTQGVPVTTLAAALPATGVSAAGAALLQKAGAGSPLQPQLAAFYRAALCVALPGAAVVAGLFLAEIFRFCRGRERLLRAATGAVARFAQGDFKRHLPRGGEGALYRLFSGIDGLATALQAKGENERRGRVALQDAVADISHQLKTPLAAISMYTEIMAGAPEDAGAVRHFTQKTQQSLERMQALIFALLKVLRLDAGSVVFAAQPTPVAELARRAAQELVTRAGAEGKQLCFAGDPQAVLCCDAQWTAEALANLIKNALEHTPPGGHICVYWQRTPAMRQLCVWDDGEGIAPDDLPFLFKRFYRSRHSTDAQGAGLGLPMAKAIVEQQGGLLDVQSDAAGGTVFTMSFGVG